jgi:BASS family bile acid:Na+ symporter
MSSLAKGNAALSVSLTAFATVLAIVMTPLNLAMWGSLYEPTAGILSKVSLDVFDVFKTIVTILGIPLVLGMLGRYYFSKIADFVKPYMQILSILIFAVIVTMAFSTNFDLFLLYIKYVIYLVLIHNAIAMTTGFQLGRLFGLDLQDKRTLAIETGIQNSGLGLLLIFNFFEGMGGMAIVAAWWGIWHILSGLFVAFLWNRKSLTVST